MGTPFTEPAYDRTSARRSPSVVGMALTVVFGTAPPLRDGIKLKSTYVTSSHELSTRRIPVNGREQKNWPLGRAAPTLGSVSQFTLSAENEAGGGAKKRMAGDPKLPKLADRLAWIVAKRKKTVTGRKMSASALSKSAGLVRQHVWQLIKMANRTGASHDTIAAIAWAAQVSLGWLSTGRGDPDDPDIPGPPVARPKPPLPGTYGELKQWANFVSQAKSLPRPIEPPEAAVAGAEMPIPRWASERLTAMMVRAICEAAWQMAPLHKQGEWADRFIRESFPDPPSRRTAPASKPKRK